MRSSDSTAHIARDVAQRRVALLLLPLRLWIGVAWLRAGLEKALQAEWFDGTAMVQFVQQQADAGTAPWLLYVDLLARLVERAASPLGLAVMGAQIAIGLCLITGSLTNLALLTAIAININLILAGIAMPSQFYIVIQVVLLAGGAGAAYGMDRWLSRVLRTSLLTGHRGLVDGVELSRAVLFLLAVAASGLAVAAVPTIRSVLPEQGVDDPGFVVLALALVIALLAVALTASTHRASEGEFADDPLGIGFPPADFGGPRGLRSSGPGSPVPGSPVPGLAVPGPAVPGPAVPGPAVPGPAVPGPAGPGPPGRGSPPFDGANGVPPRRPVPDNRVPVASPPRGRPGGSRPAAQPRPPSDPWDSPGPLDDPRVPRPAPQDQPTTAMQSQTRRPRPAVRDQPTTQFVRQRRSRAPQGRQTPPPNDPYAELRELPP